MKTVYYLLNRHDVNDTPTEAILDMLRYDGARVEGNAPRGFYLLAIDSDTGRRPNQDRWRSFGLEVIAEADSPSGFDPSVLQPLADQVTHS